MSAPLSLLMVEDELNLAKVIGNELKANGWLVTPTSTGGEAMEALQERFDVMLLDLNLPDIAGLDVLGSIAGDENAPEVVVLTGNADVENAVKAMKYGAYDYIQKPVSMEKLGLILGKAAEKSRLRFRNMQYRRQVDRLGKATALDLVIASWETAKAFELAAQAAEADAAVLLLGETGVGKDVLARYIHDESHRSGGPFISINCAAFQEPTLENELFGHEKGAFTGAVDRKLGFFEIASGGTLLLDEISEMQAGMQAKMLHVLENGSFYRVGGTRIVRSDVRVITATNKDLDEMVQRGSFRDDLYYRINMFSIEIPPLRRRKKDIMPLAERFLYETNSGKTIGDRARSALIEYDWPGNVRELKHVIQRAAIVAKGDVIEQEDVFLRHWNDQTVVGARDNDEGAMALDEIEARHIVRVLSSVEWKRSEAAGILGIDPKTLYRKIKKYRIEPD